VREKVNKNLKNGGRRGRVRQSQIKKNKNIRNERGRGRVKEKENLKKKRM
jgi:hypothetical protein